MEFRNPQSAIRNRTTILNVDDDEASRYIVSRILRQAGFEVMEAANGAEALRLVRERPDLVTLDVNLPDINGFEVCRRIKADSATSLIPILVISATYMDDQSVVTGLESGAEGYLTQPVEPLVLTAYVKALLQARQAQETLRESEARLRGLFKTMAEGVILIAPDGQIIQANPAAERILGLKRSEIEARNYVGPEWEILRPDGTPMPPEEMAGPRAMEEKRLVENVVMGIKRPDGSVSWINISAAPLTNEAGGLEGVVGTFADITARKRAEEALRESKETLRTIFAASPDCVYVSDTEGRVLDANPTVLELVGLSLEQMQERNVLDFFAGDDPSELLQAASKLRAGEEVRGLEAKAKLVTGEIQDYEVHAIPLRERGVVTAILSVARDITERKRAEEALQELNATLEERVRERTFELQVLYELSQKIGYTLNYDELFRLMLEHLHHAIAYDVSASLLATGEGGQLFIKPTRPLSPAVREEIQERLISTFAQLSDQAVDLEQLNTQVLKVAAFDETAPPIARLGSLFQVPLIMGEEKGLVGLFLFVGAEREGAFTEDQVRLLYTVANQASVSIQRLHAMLDAEQQRLESLVENLPEGVLLLDAQGRILLANPAGREVLTLLTDADVGDVLTYLGGRPLADLLGPPPEGEACHEMVPEGSPHRVFEVMTQPMETGPQAGGQILAIRDVTDRKRAEEAEAQARANAERIERLERELRSLEQLSAPPSAAVTAQLFGLAPLRESVPDTFNELVQRYGNLMDLALEQRAYRVEHNISERLRSLAERVGFLKAGPRDVVEIHSTALKRKTREVIPAKAQAYVEEGRLMVLELMGYLVSYYRNR
jgi:PAS domain S-box-containing protein